MTQWVVIKNKDGLEAEVVKEAADDVWVPVMGWEIVGEPTDYQTRDPFAPAVTEESAAEEEAPAAEDGVQTPTESNQEGSTEAV